MVSRTSCRRCSFCFSGPSQRLKAFVIAFETSPLLGNSLDSSTASPEGVEPAELVLTEKSSHSFFLPFSAIGVLLFMLWQNQRNFSLLCHFLLMLDFTVFRHIAINECHRDELTARFTLFETIDIFLQSLNGSNSIPGPWLSLNHILYDLTSSIFGQPTGSLF